MALVDVFLSVNRDKLLSNPPPLSRPAFSYFIGTTGSMRCYVMIHREGSKTVGLCCGV